LLVSHLGNPQTSPRHNNSRSGWNVVCVKPVPAGPDDIDQPGITVPYIIGLAEIPLLSARVLALTVGRGFGLRFSREVWADLYRVFPEYLSASGYDLRGSV
jgi:hypothetical protein